MYIQNLSIYGANYFTLVWTASIMKCRIPEQARLPFGFLKLFNRNKMAWMFGLLWIMKKIVNVKACFGKIWSKFTIFFENLKFVFVILEIFYEN